MDDFGYEKINLDQDPCPEWDLGPVLTALRSAQQSWGERPVSKRVAVIGRLRRLIARDAWLLADAVGARPGRAPGETLALDVLPLADACRFLEAEAGRLLAPRRLGVRGRPVWLFGTAAEIRREPFGVVLVLSPSNYPLFLPGVQIVQALTAGNAVLVKPAPGCTTPLAVLSDLLREAGLPDGLLMVLDEDVEAGRAAIAAGVDKVVLTGSAATGRQVLADLAPHLTPAVMELSGNDPVFVLPGADLDMVTAALTWGLGLNGGATCIAPRRVFVARELAQELENRLAPRIDALPPVAVPERVRRQVAGLIDEALAAGCRVIGRPVVPDQPVMTPVLVADAVPELGLLQEDVFAPVQSLVPVADEDDALAAAKICSYALGASIFGPERKARELARRVRAGSIVVNDLIVPTADPRLPFGGRGMSGFGVTRGAEGLLELTLPKAVSVHRGRLRPHFDPFSPADADLIASYIAAAHGEGGRMAAIRRIFDGVGQRVRQRFPSGGRDS